MSVTGSLKKSDGVVLVFITRIETVYVFARLNWT
jgi:hypothetical protein